MKYGGRPSNFAVLRGLNAIKFFHEALKRFYITPSGSLKSGFFRVLFGQKSGFIKAKIRGFPFFPGWPKFKKLEAVTGLFPASQTF